MAAATQYFIAAKTGTANRALAFAFYANATRSQVPVARVIHLEVNHAGHRGTGNTKDRGVLLRNRYSV